MSFKWALSSYVRKAVWVFSAQAIDQQLSLSLADLALLRSGSLALPSGDRLQRNVVRLEVLEWV